MQRLSLAIILLLAASLNAAPALTDKINRNYAGSYNYQVPEQLKKIGDTALCRNATDENGNWEKIESYQKFVLEAQNRDLDLEKCSLLTGRLNPKIAKGLVNAKSRNWQNLNQVEQQLRVISDIALCRNATNKSGKWEDINAYKKYVDEAKRRNFSLAQCNSISGRVKTVKKSNSNLLGNYKYQVPEQLKKIGDTALCRNATDENGNWEKIESYQKFVLEAQNRDLDLGKCSLLTGRPNPNPPKKLNIAETTTSKKSLEQAFTSLKISDRLLLQKRLTDFGFYQSSIDGVFGDGTRGAVEAYALSQGKPVDFKEPYTTQFLQEIIGPKVVRADVPLEQPSPTQSISKNIVARVNGEKRIALVIGNGAYPNVGELTNPPNDARLMTETLRALNFDVIERVNAGQKDMKRAIKLFGEKLEEAGKDAVGLFYFAGHGVQVGGSNYLIPVNVDIEDESDVDIEAVSANTVQQQMAYAGNRLNMIVMDACRNNPFKRGFRSASRGLARMDATKGTLIAYATSPGDVAVDGSGQNSPYTEALSKALLTPGLTVERVFKEVRNSVVAATNNRQVPWEASSLTGGDYYFTAPSIPDAVANPAVIPPSTTSNEVLVWNSIKDSNDPVLFRTFLQQYPSGLFKMMAAAKLKALESKSSK